MMTTRGQYYWDMVVGITIVMLTQETHKNVLYIVRVVVLNDTFNNISVISWRSVLLLEKTGENHIPVASH